MVFEYFLWKSSQMQNPRDNLMEEIRNKKLSGGLRHVTEQDKVKPKPAEGRDALLEQVWNNFCLLFPGKNT